MPQSHSCTLSTLSTTQTFDGKSGVNYYNLPRPDSPFTFLTQLGNFSRKCKLNLLKRNNEFNNFVLNILWWCLFMYYPQEHIKHDVRSTRDVWERLLLLGLVAVMCSRGNEFHLLSIIEEFLPCGSQVNKPYSWINTRLF